MAGTAFAVVELSSNDVAASFILGLISAIGAYIGTLIIKEIWTRAKRLFQ
jgi:hypothetical protein